MARILQPGDLAAADFANAGGANNGSVTIKTDATSNVGIAIANAVAGLPADIYVTSGAYNPATDTFTYTRSDSSTFTVAANGLVADIVNATIANVQANGEEIQDNSGATLGFLVQP